jgi:exopolysaccharide biosynthesis polyprenyl glycosylphosphotransferase
MAHIWVHEKFTVVNAASVMGAILVLSGLRSTRNLARRTSLGTLICKFSQLVIITSSPIVAGVIWGGADQNALVWLFSWISFLLLGLISAHMVFGVLRRRWSQTGLLSQRVVVYGTGIEARCVLNKILYNENSLQRLVAVLDCRSRRTEPLSGLVNPQEGITDLAKTIADLGCDEMVIALPLTAAERINDLCNRVSHLPVTISLAAVGFESRSMRLPSLADIPLIPLSRPPLDSWAQMRKRLYDCFLAAGLLLCLAPVMIGITIAIKLDSRGPVLFRQTREGRNGNKIHVLKYRTMYAEQADPLCESQSSDSDPRVTRAGRVLRNTGLDELPQLVNVLLGDMSIVGPRPHAIAMKIAGQLSSDGIPKYRRRGAIKPGITGWAQINGSRGPVDTTTSMRERVSLDLYYVENWSDFLDLKIFLLSVAQFVRDLLAVRKSRQLPELPKGTTQYTGPTG